MILGAALPNIPWQKRPAGSSELVWRYSGNPVIGRDATPTSNSVFNSAVVPFRDGFAGVFRIDDRRRFMQLHTGFSPDGIRWGTDAGADQLHPGVSVGRQFHAGIRPARAVA